MRVVIRVDASVQIGSGHVMRCLTLADELRNGGASVTFVCRLHPGNLCDLIAAKDHNVVRLPPGEMAGKTAAQTMVSHRLEHAHWLGVSQQEDARESAAALADTANFDWLIVDHYGLDAQWETAMRPSAKRVMVIDDLADRKHDCDVLLDQNLNRDMERRYEGLVPASCIALLGPGYALLRPEFAQARQTLRKRDGSVQRIFVFFGGIDAGNETGKTLEAISRLTRRDIAVDVVIGSANPHAAHIAGLCASLQHATLHRQVENIAELMARADLAVGAGGGAMWERFCVGLPTILISVAANQQPGSETAACAGKLLYLGPSEAVSADTIVHALEMACASPCLLKNFSEAGLALVSGQGARRIARRLHSADLVLRRATSADCEAIYRWRNAEETRRFSGDGESIPYASHAEWYARAIQDPYRVILIGEQDGNPVGVLRYDRDGETATVSIYLVPGNQGRGLGPALLEQGTRWIAQNWPEVQAIDAWIKPVNRASIAAFKETGYSGQYEIYSKRIRG